MVGGPDQIGVILDGDDGPAEIDEPLEGGQQTVDVGPVEAGRRLLQDVERASLSARLSSEASLIRWASPPDRVVELWPSFMYPRPRRFRPRVGAEPRLVGEEDGRVVDAHFQDVMDVHAAVPDGERLVVEAAALAVGADDIHVAQEMHADLEQPGPLAGSHRPPVTLKENRPLPKPRARASGNAAKRSRIRSQIPV